MLSNAESHRSPFLAKADLMLSAGMSAIGSKADVVRSPDDVRF
jgi:hypothetical protein